MRWLDRYGPAVGYAAGLAAVGILLGLQARDTRARWLAWASTNLANATTHPLRALAVSAFVSDGDVIWWVPLALVALGTVGVTFGAWRTAVLVGAAHVIGTVVSEGIVAYRVASGGLPSSYRFLVDVGPSYVVVAALAAGIGYARWPGRLLCAAGFVILAPDLFGGLFRLEVSAVGHVTAILVALVTGGGYVLARRRTG